MSEFSTKIIHGRERLILSLLLETDAAESQEASPGVESRIGPYVLAERLGEGRVGVVWRARQEQPFQREVVVKLMKPGMDSRQDIALFSLERQALAALDHPSIVALLDVGLTTDGRPYFVMEHAAGRSFSELARDTTATWQEKLGLFMEVCSAISHAHSRGIIHLDLQPSNIKIAESEGKLVPKVINFGVARTLPRQWWGDLAPTQGPRPRLVTRFTSPEQLAGGAGADHRSDVFALGAMLHELLSGTKFSEAGSESHQGCLDVPAGLREVVRLATAMKPEDRLENMDALCALLTPLAERTVCSAEDGSS